MADWVTISSLATATGTLVLATAAFASVRSANRTARAAERSLQAGLRPLLIPSRFDDPLQKVGFIDDHCVALKGGFASAEVEDGNIYLGSPSGTPATASPCSTGGTSIPSGTGMTPTSPTPNTSGA